MADVVVVLDNVLCFLLARYGKTTTKQLKDVVLDFYSTEDICRAKDTVLRDTESWKSEVNLPHIPLRREGELRASKSLDDIFTVLTCLDENLKLKYLPKYAADSPDSMPSIRVYDGDLWTLMAAFDKLKDRMTSTEVALSAILEAVNVTKDMLITPSVQSASKSVTRSRPPTFIQPVIDSVRGQSDINNAVGNETTGTVVGNSRQTAGHTAGDSDSDVTWAKAVAAASTPSVSHNRYSVLQHLDDFNDSDGNDNNPFVEHRSRRSAKRLRQQSTLQQQQPQAQQPRAAAGAGAVHGRDMQRGASNNAGQRRGRVMMTGKSKQVICQRFVAAKTIIKKAVFCVDNLSTSVTVDDLKQFVAGMSVDVITCFSVKPRRLRNETEPAADRAAFRLCIAEKDRDRLLNESMWPDSVVISEWFHVNIARRRQRSQTEEEEESSTAAATDRRATASDLFSNNDAEDTVVYCDGPTESVRMDTHTTSDHD